MMRDLSWQVITLVRYVQGVFAFHGICAVAMRVVCIIVFLVHMVSVQPSFAEDNKTATSEAEVKARIMLNIVLVSKWPSYATQQNTSSKRICVFGKGDYTWMIQRLLKKSATNTHWNNLQLVIMHRVDASALIKCHVVYINAEHYTKWRIIRRMIKNSAILTFSDMPHFVDQGGSIGFVANTRSLGVFEDQQVGFEVNLARVRDVGIRVDPLLLELASRIVED